MIPPRRAAEPGQRLHVLPAGADVPIGPGETLLDALTAAGYGVPATCGGAGVCGRCAVRFVDDPPAATPADRARLDPERIELGWRLACMHRLQREASVWLPTRVADRVTPGIATSSIPIVSPIVTEHAIVRVAASGGAPQWTPQARRDRDSLLRSGHPPEALSAFLSQNEVVRVAPSGTSPPLCGLALDVGTTTLGLQLVDLRTGAVGASLGTANPQSVYGEDVVTRIAWIARHGPTALLHLSRVLRHEIDSAVRDLLATAGIDPADVLAAIVVGNPTMLHVLFGVDPTPLGRSPYTPRFRSGLTVPAENLGIHLHPETRVRSLPIISGFVGADAVACAVDAFAPQAGESSLVIDIGTNAEMILDGGDLRTACSAAAGPALEGSTIRDGMPASPGAISRIWYDGKLRYRTIGNAPPAGLCGSGLVDLLHLLRSLGVLDPSGRISDRRARSCGLRLLGGTSDRIVVADSDERAAPISLDQRDVRRIQLSLAAIRAGIGTLLDASGIAAADLDRVTITGSFGFHLNPQALIGLGVVPPGWADRIRPAPNAAISGAARVLGDVALLEEAERIARETVSVPLAANPEYKRRFLEAMRFPDPLPKTPVGIEDALFGRAARSGS